MVKIATWNTDNPKTSNQILEDVADIEENLQELHDVIAAITDGTLGTTEPAAFKVDTVAADTISEASGASGVTVDGLLLKDGEVKLGLNKYVYTDDDDDTYIGSTADDVIRLGTNNADQVLVTDGTVEPGTDNDVDLGTDNTKEFKAIYAKIVQARTNIYTNVIYEVTGAAGVTIDGLLIKDAKIAQANSIDSDAYIDGSIDLAHMSAESIDSAQYVDGSIDLEHIASGVIPVQLYSYTNINGTLDDTGVEWSGTDLLGVGRFWYYHTGNQATLYIKGRVTDAGNGETSVQCIFGAVTVTSTGVDNTTADTDGSGDISGVAAGWVEVSCGGKKSASSANSSLIELGVTIL